MRRGLRVFEESDAPKLPRPKRTSPTYSFRFPWLGCRDYIPPDVRTMKPLPESQLYAFVDTAYLRGRPPEAIAQQLCDGGADLIQLRAKQSPLDEVRRLAEAILPVTQRAGIALVINDHLSLAQEL